MDKVNTFHQIEFSSLLFDTFFGLILFFSIEAFLDIKEPIHFIFYLISTIIVLHWWLGFKSVDDLFGEEVAHSSLDVLMGVVYLILLEFVVLLSERFEYTKAAAFLIALLALDLVWALVWRYIGKWHTTNDPTRIRAMEKELDIEIRINIVIIALFTILMLIAPIITVTVFVTVYGLLYLFFVFLTYKYKIIDLDIY